MSNENNLMARDKGDCGMICEHFAKTKIKLPLGHQIEAECKICPLRDDKGDCPVDIAEDLILIASERISEIWRKYYECNRT